MSEIGEQWSPKIAPASTDPVAPSRIADLFAAGGMSRPRRVRQ